MTIIKGPCAHGQCVLYLDGQLLAPVDGCLRHLVRALLRRGERTIVLDLTRVSTLDAAGVSELVRTYNMAVHVNGIVQVAHASVWVQQILATVGLFEILTAGKRPPVALKTA
jgi:anti-anti-sigma factor